MLTIKIDNGTVGVDGVGMGRHQGGPYSGSLPPVILSGTRRIRPPSGRARTSGFAQSLSGSLTRPAFVGPDPSLPLRMTFPLPFLCDGCRGQR